ncbi:NADH-quinone oxidoreductase subunit L [Salinibacter ruber]|uniref:NADH-quinone oxidoreductase subunit L n=1 Tax=Salinibacter ruber TaxID=146919 RepID=UPI002166EDD9|nr:NADH-quinone oxidoreductase subunit L [Salinibacter ruber]MCS3634387.1 NADH-quinone oxidoreductase subunit L [Salinibacter ruber]MCS3713877.1 NADH-quinone oxidoreductase subunit L [Salinibacter ruber]
MTSADLLRLVLLLPLAGAVLNGVAPLFLKHLRTRETLVGTVGTAVVAIPFVLTVYLFVTFGGDPIVADYFTWMAAGDLDLSFAYRIDQLSLLMTGVVTGVGGVIHLYSIGYMHGDAGYWRFFAYLNLFIFAMLNLVLANNLPVLFLGWEGVGLCSYLLIGFWYTDLSNSAAANKAFIVNRVGDFAFLVAMFLVFQQLGSLSFDVLLTEGPNLPEATLNWIVFLLFVGATGKSAQIPLFVWLPDAMAGPTPVSALIHAATMVTSGLYLLARLSALVLGAPVVMMIIAIVGAATALMAATIAIAQDDIKRVLAYSTVSQLGYMFMAAGVGAFFVSIFHVITHAFFKACLFLGSGSVIHGMEEVEHGLEEEGRDTGDFDPQDMRTMGGVGEYMPATRTTYLLATLAISGIPLTAGFFSKDEILFKAFEYGYDGFTYAMAVWGVGIVTAVLTAFYMMRSYMLTFEGEPRWPLSDQVSPHESPSTMTGPLWTLGILSLVGGFIGLPAVIQGGDLNWIHHYLGAKYGGPVAEASVHGHVPLALEWGLILLSSVIALGTVYYAWRVYGTQGLEYDAALQRQLRGVYQTWSDKYYWDEFYDEVVVDSLINGIARKGLTAFDTTVVDGAVNGVAGAAQNASGLLRRVQTGLVQNYALALTVGAALLVGLLMYGV